MDTVTNTLKRTPIAAILLASVKTLGLSFVAFLLLLEIFKDKTPNMGTGTGFYIVGFFFLLLVCLGVYIGILLLFYVLDKKKFHELDRKSLIERQMPFVCLLALIPIIILTGSFAEGEMEFFIFVFPFYLSIIFGYIFFIFDAKKNKL
jgi:heme/copper-type cytochrome/quinol oxidase subunit 2